MIHLINYDERSHDQFIEDENGVLVGTGPKYASQRAVFEDLGQGVLNNAFEGITYILVYSTSESMISLIFYGLLT